jgi:hypothetical protein
MKPRVKLLRISIAAILTVLSLGICVASAADAAALSLLPKQFGGWQLQGLPLTSADPAAADGPNAAVLKEYGFTDFESAAYSTDDGRTLKIRAARFQDASGGFGAYTFYLRPEMLREQIGDQGASLNERVLFYRGNVLVDAVFSRLSVMSAADLRELAGMLPQATGNAANLPPLLAFMPHQGYVANTQKYFMGPAAYRAQSSPVPSELVDFGASAEVVLGKYASSAGGEGTLMLIEYPTPQLAAAHFRNLEAAHQMKPAEPGIASVGDAGTFFDKRSGPIVAIVSGPLSQSGAQTLLGLVTYEANVTWNENTYFDKKNDMAGFLVNVIVLCGILMALAITVGVGFGGVRILVKRFFPDRVFDRPGQMEFISLRIDEGPSQNGGENVPRPSSRSAEVPPNSR